MANSIQDVGKTEQQLAENRQVRNDGGSTNKISEWLNREGKGGSTANEIKDRVDKTANPVLDNVGEAAYDAKGVVTMAGSGDVSGMVGAAAGAAAGVGAILNATGAVGGSRSDNGNTGEGNEQPTVQTQEQSTTPTLDRLMQGDELLSTPALREHAAAIQEVDALEQEKRRLQNAGASVEEINAVNDKLKEAEKRRDEAGDAAYNDYKTISENKNDQLADELKKRSEEQDLQFKIEAEQRRNAYSNGR